MNHELGIKKGGKHDGGGGESEIADKEICSASNPAVLIIAKTNASAGSRQASIEIGNISRREL